MEAVAPISASQDATYPGRPRARVSSEQSLLNQNLCLEHRNGAPSHKLRRSKSVVNSLRNLVPRRKSRRDDTPKVKHSKSASRSGESSSEQGKRERRGSVWGMFTTKRLRQPMTPDHNAKSEALSRTVTVHGHATKSLRDIDTRPRRRKSLGDILGNITDKVTTRRNTLAQCSATRLVTPPPQLNPAAALEPSTSVDPSTSFKLYGAEGPMPLVGEHGNAATFEDMNAFETRLEDIVSSFKRNQTERLMGSLGSSTSWQSQQTLHDSKNDQLTNLDAPVALQSPEKDPDNACLNAMELLTALLPEQASKEVGARSDPTRNRKLTVFSLPFRFKSKKLGRSQDSDKDQSLLPSPSEATANCAETDDASQAIDIDPTLNGQFERRTKRYEDIPLSGEQPVRNTCRFSNYESGAQAAETSAQPHMHSSKGKQSVRIVGQGNSELHSSRVDIDDGSAGPMNSFDTTEEPCIFDAPEIPSRHPAHTRHVSFDIRGQVATTSRNGSDEATSMSPQNTEESNGHVAFQEDSAAQHDVLNNSAEPSSSLKIDKNRRVNRSSGFRQISEQPVEVRLPTDVSLDADYRLYASKGEAIADLFTAYHDQINEFMTYDPNNRIIQTYSAIDQVPDEQDRRSKRIETIWLPLRNSAILRDSMSRNTVLEPQILSPSRASSNISGLVLDASSPYHLLTPESSLEDEGSIRLSEHGDIDVAPFSGGFPFEDSNTRIISVGADVEKWQKLWRDPDTTFTAADCLEFSNAFDYSANCDGKAHATSKTAPVQEDVSPTKTWLDLGREHVLARDPKTSASNPASIESLGCNASNGSQSPEPSHLSGFKFTDYSSILHERSISCEQRGPSTSQVTNTPTIEGSTGLGRSGFQVEENVELTREADSPPAISKTLVVPKRTDGMEKIFPGSLMMKRIPITPKKGAHRRDQQSSSGISSIFDFDENTAPEKSQATSGATFPRVARSKPENHMTLDEFNLRVVGKGAQNSRFAKQGGKRVATLIDLFQARSIMATPTPQRPQRTPPRQYPGLGLTNRSPSLLMHQSPVLQPVSKCAPSSGSRSCSGISTASTQCDSMFGTTLEQMKRE